MTEADTTFAILADPSRRKLLDSILARERTVNELAQLHRLSQPAVSRHLRLLRDADFVAVRIDAQRRWYRAEPSALQELDAWLAPYRQAWTRSLDALGAHLAASVPAGSGGQRGPDTSVG